MVLERTDSTLGPGKTTCPRTRVACFPVPAAHLTELQSDHRHTALAPQPHPHRRPMLSPSPLVLPNPEPAAWARSICDPLVSQPGIAAAQSPECQEGSERSSETFRIDIVKLVTQPLTYR